MKITSDYLEKLREIILNQKPGGAILITQEEAKRLLAEKWQETYDKTFTKKDLKNESK